MTTMTAEETRAAQAEVVISAEEIDQKLKAVGDSLVAKLEKYTEDYGKRLEAQAALPELATPNLPGGYQYWNVLTAGPYQFFANPPYRPGKIIAAGRPAYMIGLIWVNPLNGPGASLPGTIVLGGRPYTMRFESINLTDVVNGPTGVFPGVFGSPANVVTPIYWQIPTPDPGASPNLYEVNMTIDVTLGGQPFAAFSTWHWDPDFEPPFLGRPPMPNHWQFERPARYMIFRL